MSAATSGEPFSVLLPVYAGDRRGFVVRSLTSVTVEQTRPPSEVVVVRDGPIDRDLEYALDEHASENAIPFTTVVLQRNVGLACALESGLAACSYDLVARQDADDISLPHRFERQLPILEAGADLVGSGLLEFDQDEHQVVGRRTPPVDPSDIVVAAAFQDPFNHPSVVYRRRVVSAAGGYEDLPLLEDYWLFVRMIALGARTANIAEPLVLYRVGSGSYGRRGGWRLLQSEVELQRRMRELGFLSRGEYVRNVAVRGGYRLVPGRIRRWGYRRLLGHWEHASAPAPSVREPSPRR